MCNMGQCPNLGYWKHGQVFTKSEVIEVHKTKGGKKAHEGKIKIIWYLLYSKQTYSNQEDEEAVESRQNWTRRVKDLLVVLIMENPMSYISAALYR